MHRRVLLLLAVLLAGCSSTDRSGGSGGDSAEVDAIPPDEVPKLGAASQEELARNAKSSNAFAFDLFRRATRPTENAALSPFSISMALTMTWAGAKGETGDEMKKVLHLEASRDEVLLSAAKTSASLQSADRPFKLRTANRLFGEKTATFESAFIGDTKKFFGAPLAPLDFKGKAEPSRKIVNGWVEKQTDKRITDLLPKDSITGETRLVLVNAIYFLADWAAPFEKEKTRDAPFTVSPSTVKQVPTMHERGTFAFVQKDGVKLLRVAYRGESMSMVFVLPDAVDGLPAVEGSMTGDSFKALAGAMASTVVEVALPKFEVNPSAPLALNRPLAELGMALAFKPGVADLTGIANPPNPTERLFISDVFHKAFVKVDEKGTEAAAATAVVVAAASASPVTEPKPVPEFRADHPFLFFIVDDASGLIVFMGRVADPSTK